MFYKYITLSFRRLSRERLYSFIKISGLAVALCCTFLIYLYAIQELSYDKHNQYPDQLYRVIQLPTEGSEASPTATTPFPLRDRILIDYPHLFQTSARLFNQRVPKVSFNYIDGNKQFNETRFFFADSTIFQIFKVEFIEGDSQSPLANPNGLVMTEPTARRYFGSENAIGKTVRLEGRIDLVVTAVIAPLPETSHVQFDMLGAFEAIKGIYVSGIPTSWEWNICWTYVRSAPGVGKSQLDNALRTISDDIQDQRDISPIHFSAQPVPTIRLHSELFAEIGPVSNMFYIKLVSYIGLFVLLIAGINFINLSLASASGRSKEVGMRKVLGGQKHELFSQHLTEAVVIGVISLVVAFLLILLALPWFGNLTGKSAGIFTLLRPDFLLFALSTTLFVTIISGIYPSLVMSSWSPVQLFKPGMAGKPGKFKLSHVLIVLQFVVASVLISGTWMAFKQIEHVKNQRLGFDQEQVLMVPTSLTRLIFFYDTFREQVLTDPSVISVTGLSAVMGFEHQVFGYEVEDQNSGSKVSYPFYFIMDGFQETFRIPLVAGRYFRENSVADRDQGLLVNETFVRNAGWESPEEALGKLVVRDDLRRSIIGVVSDFNFSSLHTGLEPLVLEYPQLVPTQIAYLAIRIAPGDPSRAIEWINSKWKEIDPTRPMEYFYLDDKLGQLYIQEEKFLETAGFFTLISIIISCVGLFGLASFTTQKRSKSIGVHKVMGAGTGQIVYLLSKEFLILVLIANLIALPIMFYGMNNWLQNFAYRIPIDFLIPAFALIITIVIAFLSVSYQTVRAASRNPVDSIRYE